MTDPDLTPLPIAGDSESPPLDPYAEEQITKTMHRVLQAWWSSITQMRLEKHTVPVPPPQPIELLNRLKACAWELFTQGANEYQQFRSNGRSDPRWLSELSDRVVKQVMAAVDTIGGASESSMSVAELFLTRLLSTPTNNRLLSPHGVTKIQIEKELRQMLEELICERVHIGSKCNGKDSDPQVRTMEPTSVSADQSEARSMPAAKIIGNGAPHAEPQPQGQSRATSRRGGRPRNDVDRTIISKMRATGKSWKEIAATRNKATGQNKTADAYRKLLETGQNPGQN